MSDKVLLCSFPKSGSNWVRYCIAYCSGRPAPGSMRRLLHHAGEPIVSRTRFPDESEQLARERRMLRQPFHAFDLCARVPSLDPEIRMQLRDFLPERLGPELYRNRTYLGRCERSAAATAGQPPA
jgi:hypothetical protein